MWFPPGWSRMVPACEEDVASAYCQRFIGAPWLMPSFFHLMVGLGGTALAVGIVVLWLHAPPPPSSSSDTLSTSPRRIGNSTLSHGGPLPDRILTTAPFSSSFQIGQKVIVASEEYASKTVGLLPSPPDSATSSPSSEVPRTLTVGTVAIVSGMRVTEPVPGRPEQYYEVTVPSGAKGWLSARALRQAANE